MRNSEKFSSAYLKRLSFHKNIAINRETLFSLHSPEQVNLPTLLFQPSCRLIVDQSLPMILITAPLTSVSTVNKIRKQLPFPLHFLI